MQMIRKIKKHQNKEIPPIYIDKLPVEGWNENIHLFLNRTIPGKKGIAVFDFDNTLIHNDLGEAVMFSLIGNGLEKFSGNFHFYFRDKIKAKSIWKKKDEDRRTFSEFILSEYRFHSQNSGVESAYRWTSFIFSGWEKSEMRQYSRDIWNRNINSDLASAIRPYKPMQDLVSFLKFHGWIIYIVTASPAWVIEEVSREFYLESGSVIGMNLVMSGDRNTPEIIEPYTYGEGKVSAFLQKTGQSPDLAFGDSENDLYLLASAKIKGVLIDKGDPVFRDKCLANNFLIQPVFR